MSVIKALSFTAITLLLATGCASQQEKLADDIRDRERAMRELEEDRREWAQQDARREMRQVPDWAMAPAPAPDSSGVYAVASANSDDLQLAIRKARLQGLFDLGQAITNAVSGLERLHSRDDGGRSNRSYSQAVQAIVDWTDVTGAETLRQEVVPIDGRFHAFVLMKLPFDAANVVVQERGRRSGVAAEREAFDEFQKVLQEYRNTLPAPQAIPVPEAAPAAVQALPGDASASPMTAAEAR